VEARLHCEVDPVVLDDPVVEVVEADVVETLPVVEDEDVDAEVDVDALEQMVLRTETETPLGIDWVLGKRATNPALTVLPMGKTGANDVKEY